MWIDHLGNHRYDVWPHQIAPYPGTTYVPYSPPPSPISQGWVCPKCGRVYGPTIGACGNCNGPAITYKMDNETTGEAK